MKGIDHSNKHMGKCQNRTPEKKTKKKTKYPCPESIGDQVVPNLGSATDVDELVLLSDDENIDFASCSMVFKSELPSNSNLQQESKGD